MNVSRLSLALDTGALEVPQEGRIAVFVPKAGTDLRALPKERVHVIQGFWPDHSAFEAAGYDVGVAPEGEYAMAVVFLSRAKAEARSMIAQAIEITKGGPVVIDGQKTDGVDSILKDCRRHGASDMGALAKAHGKLFTITGGDFADWASYKQERRIKGGFLTAPGVFSADAVDKGSAALIAALPEKLSGRVADLGAGWGYLSHHVLQHETVTECHLIEAEHAALECARRNVTDERAHFHWADATKFGGEGQFNTIVCNPPFHTGRAAEPALGKAFIATAARILSQRGVLWLVANRHLPYEAALSEAFIEVEEVNSDPAFKVFCASKPRRAKR